jgi:hypothetical protein
MLHYLHFLYSSGGARLSMASLCHLQMTYLSVALVREQTIPTERQSFVGEVSANFQRRKWSNDGNMTANEKSK